MQYKLVPVAEHPLFPGIQAGINTIFSLTREQYQDLSTSNVNVVFATVVKNEAVLNKGINIFQAM